MVVIQEAGLDGFWLGRVLSKEAWIESQILEAASIAMPRRHRRAKTDRIDGETLIRALIAWKRGEPRACSMVKLLTPEEDDNRRIGRERKTLIAERVFHVNRIKGLLFAQGIREYEPVNRDRRQRLGGLRTGDGRPLSKHLRAEICRELDRLELLLAQINAVEAERDALIVRETSETPKEATALLSIKGIGPEFATILYTERLFPTLRQPPPNRVVRRPCALPLAKRQRQPRTGCIQGGKSAFASHHGRTCLAMVATSTEIDADVMVQGSYRSERRPLEDADDRGARA